MKKGMIVFMTLVLMFCFGGAVFGGTAASENKPSYYMTVEVQKGDTVWSIAETYNDDSGLSTAEYTEKIMEFNRMAGDKLIIGQRLQVPVY